MFLGRQGASPLPVSSTLPAGTPPRGLRVRILSLQGQPPDTRGLKGSGPLAILDGSPIYQGSWAGLAHTMTWLIFLSGTKAQSPRKGG